MPKYLNGFRIKLYSKSNHYFLFNSPIKNKFKKAETQKCWNQCPINLIGYGLIRRVPIILEIKDNVVHHGHLQLYMRLAIDVVYRKKMQIMYNIQNS